MQVEPKVPQKKQGIKEKSADTLIVENRLRNTEEGDTVTYEALSILLGRDVRKHCRGSLTTALRTLIGESIFFDTIRNAGYTRLTAEAANVYGGKHFVRSVKSTTRRGQRYMRNIRREKLSDEGKRQHTAHATHINLLAHLAAEPAVKKINSAVKSADDMTLAIGTTLQLFGG